MIDLLLTEELHLLNSKVFHVFNRGNGRRNIFFDDQNYSVFALKMKRQLGPVAHLIAYCLMPNHFHFLLIPKHDVLETYKLDGEVKDKMPTKELAQAIQRLLMGYTKSSNSFYGSVGSIFQQHTKSVHHPNGVRRGMNYIHNNPIETDLAEHPSEWGFSSFNEYSGLIPESECFSDVALGKQLLALS